MFFFRIISALLALQTCLGVHTSRFSLETACNLELRIKDGCAKVRPNLRSLIHCAAKCSLDDGCIGVSMTESGMCFHHEPCPSSVACRRDDQRFKYWSSYCVHGHWNHTSGSCDCVNGCFGERCENYPQYCSGLITVGFERGLYYIHIDPDQDGKNPLKVVCYIEPPSYECIVVLKNGGGMDFNRTWEENVNGFYKDVGNFWLGLRTWHLLTEAGFTNAWFDLASSQNGITGTVYRRYTDLHLAPAADSYSLSFHSTTTGWDRFPSASSHFGDCLGRIQNVPFSSWDADNDSDPNMNCAAWRGSGWWYSGCDDSCNLFGWGLDNWEATPTQQRLSVQDVDMQAVWTLISYVQIYIKRLIN